MKVSAIILTGGRSQRLGRTKALETIDGKSIIEHVIERLSPQVAQIMTVTSQDQVDLRVARKTEVLVDIYPDKGPLGGIYTGLVASRFPHSIVVACDMPFLNTRLLNYMVKLSRDFDVVVPRLENGKVEPLHAIYSKGCLGIIKSQLEGGRLEAYALLDIARVRYIEQSECQRFDPKLLSFFNINDQSDLDQAIVLTAGSTKVGRGT